MLTPSTRATIRPRSLSTSALPRSQTRNLFGWKLSRLAAYNSHLDPLYPRFIRHRTLKTKAKLLKSLRRRQQFHWDAEAKPFIGVKHVRYASHWDGTNRPRSGRYSNNGENQGKNDDTAEGYELSEREKAWKKQMEAMRKRVEADPYEAVFGKRFEPFWSPLVPQWVKEELGFPSKESGKPHEPTNANSRQEKSSSAGQSNKDPERATKANDEQQSSKQTQPSETASKAAVNRKVLDFEYDPVSGRMVPIESPAAASTKQSQADVPAQVTWKPVVSKSRFSPSPASTNYDEMKIPVKTFKSGKGTPTATKPDTQGSKQKTDRPTAGQASASQPGQSELDALTAGDLRASMGKSKRNLGIQEDATPEWISEQQALKQQIRDWDNSVTRLKKQVTAIADEVSAVELGRHLPTSLDRHAQTPKPAAKARPLQPAVQRMQTKEQPEPADPDDAAAHESTEPIPEHVFVPRDWSKQEDILQSDRVKRTTEASPRPTMRWLEDIQARKALFQQQKAAADLDASAVRADEAEKVAQTKLDKANEMLQAEVASHKIAMGELQDRSAQKIRSLRGELETAYKQSSVHADAFRDRIETLNKELSQAHNTGNEVQVKSIKERYGEKVRALRKELDRAYKQSSVHADEFTERIKTLEAELRTLSKAAGGASAPKPVPKESSARDMQGEGDFCPNVAKFADSDKWYKQPSSPPQLSWRELANSEPKVVEKELKARMAELDVQKKEVRGRERALVEEVRSIYENAYGKIDVKHLQPRSVEKAALDNALTKYDKRCSYAFKEDGLESELSGEASAVSTEAPSLKKITYGYKGDELEAELANKPQIADVKEPQYAFKKDGLEAELARQDPNCAPKAAEAEYDYKKDGLEAELAKHAGSAKKSNKPEYAYKKDGLEVELASQTGPGAKKASRAEYAYKKDGLEADLIAHGMPSIIRQPREKFVPDGLEAELRSQSKPATLSQQSETFKADGLEAELKEKSKAAASSQHGQRFKPDSLEAELKRIAMEQPAYASDNYEADAAKVSAAQDTVGKMEKTMASSLGSELNMPTQSATPTVSGVQWQQPPLYKIVAYDSGNDRFSTATTTAWDQSVQEAPITITQALSQLYQPARWTHHFALLQREGYQVVDAREDVLVLKKVQETSKATEAPAVPPVTKPSEKPNPINPVDGTSRTTKDIRPVSSHYANPTGYVNLDLLEELSAKDTASSKIKDADRSTIVASSDEGDLNAEYQSFPRVSRQEPVFSGQKRARKDLRRAMRELNKEKRRRYESSRGDPKPRSLILWMLGVGAATSGVMYVAGSVAEKANEARMEREARGLEPEKGGDAARWRLDEGQWKKGK